MLCSQADLEVLRQIDVTAEPDPVVTALIRHAEGILEGLTGRRFDPVVDLELAIEDSLYEDGIIYLPHYPILDVVVTDPEGTDLDPERYHFTPGGQLYVLGVGTGVYTWDWQFHVSRGLPWLPGTVITYSGGVDDPAEAPQDLRTLCAQITASLFDIGAANAAGGPGVQSEALGGWSVSYKMVEDNLSPQQLKVARRYHHRVPIVAF